MLRRIRETECDQGSKPDKVGGPSIEISGARISQNYVICPPKSEELADERPSLGITLPYLYLTVHVPQKMDFSIEAVVLDDKQVIRRFRASTYQSDTVIKPDICTLPLTLEQGQERLARDAVLLPPKKPKVESKYNKHNAEPNSHGNQSCYGPAASDIDDTTEENDDGESNKIPCWNRLCVPLSEYTKRAYGTNYVETMWVQIHANCRLKRVYFAVKEIDEDDELPDDFRLYRPVV